MRRPPLLPPPFSAASCHLTKHILIGKNVLGVEAEAAFRAVLEPALEGRADGEEGDLAPRNRGFFEQRDLEGLLAGLEVQLEKARAVEKMHLIHARHGNQRERPAQLDPRAR